MAAGSVGTPAPIGPAPAGLDRSAAGPGRCARVSRLAGRCTCSGAERCTNPTSSSDGGRSSPARCACRQSSVVQRWTSTLGVEIMRPAFPPQLHEYVRHDTPVNGRGTRPEAKTSDTVDLRDRRRRHERNLTSPELTRADRCDRCAQPLACERNCRREPSCCFASITRTSTKQSSWSWQLSSRSARPSPDRRAAHPVRGVIVRRR